MLTEAVPVVLEGLENARIANDEREIWQSLCNLGLALSYGARYGVALECYEQATAIVNETGIWSNKGYLLLEVGEIALGLEAAQRASSLMTKVESVEQRLARVHLEVLQVRLRVAIGDIQKARCTRRLHLPRHHVQRSSVYDLRDSHPCSSTPMANLQPT